MEDGLYQIKTKYLCAGFTVKKGKIIKCAHILKKNIDFWKTKAVRIDKVID